jgi:hypothetical protein
VLRGKWVVNQLRCEVISPPPANVDTSLPDEVVTGGTLREQLEQHRTETVCAACHALMDPIGFGLENYDAIGAYRAEENGLPIDSSGELNGVPFSGPAELEAIIAGDQLFADCLIQNLYTYALGRVPVMTPEHMDGATLAALSEAFRQDYSLQTLISNIVQSQPFITRRGDPSGAGP